MEKDLERGFNIEKINLNYDSFGEVEATLISRKSKEKSQKAVLYIHGFVDYFFQYHFADWINEQGWNFYAIDLRKYGRSIQVHHKPNMTTDLRHYFEEIDKAVDIIKKRDNNETLVLVGHSTGGLIGSLYTHYNRNDQIIDGLILNSPFFEFNKPSWFIKYILPLISKIGLWFPNLPSPEGLKEGYVRSIHKDFSGEWDFDLKLKPLKGFKINFGWISAIYYAQRNLQNGLDILCPVLVLYSSKSVTPGKYHEGMKKADSVLEVSHIKKYSEGLGKNVRKVEIPNGLHDLILSNSESRIQTMNVMGEFLADYK